MSREVMILRNFLPCVIFSLSVFAVLSGQGCGLYSYPYIYPPDVSNSYSGSSGISYIINTGVNDPDVFQGYEIYYKFYDFNNHVSLHRSDHIALFSVEEPEPRDITNLGYRRANTTEDATKSSPVPMIFIDYSDRDDSFEIKMDFTNIAFGVKPYLSYSGNTIYLYRAVKDKDNDNKTFKSFITDDIDKDKDDDIGYDSVTLYMYVFAYGKYDKVYNIYSKPVELGYINY